jgi:hypothetical protein
MVEAWEPSPPTENDTDKVDVTAGFEDLDRVTITS